MNFRTGEPSPKPCVLWNKTGLDGGSPLQKTCLLLSEIPLNTAFAIAIMAQAVLPCTRMAQPKQPLAKWILIVEDDPVQARVYGQYLKKAGYTVLVATDGPTGAKQAVELKPDGVLLDIMLPGMSGVDVLRQIREKRPELPVVMYTNGFVPMMLDKA